MAKLLCFFATLLFLSSSSAAPKLQPLENKEIQLEPFSAIDDCLPFNVKVEPSKVVGAYSLSIEGEKSLVKAISAKVRNGVLSLGLNHAFETQRLIKVTVKLPRDMLETITKTSTSVLVIAPGLKTKGLTIMTSGVAAVRVFDATIDDLVVEANGSSIVFAEGEIQQARLDVDETAKTYVYGLKTNAEVLAESIGHIYIRPTTENVKIDGRVEGLGRVFVTKGSCSVEGTFFRSGCQTVMANRLPSFEAVFSCGLMVNGKISCDKDGSSSTYTSSRVDQSTGSSFASSSSSSAATSTSSSVKTSTSVRTSGKTSTGGGTTSTSTSSSSSAGKGTTSTSTSSSSSVGGDYHFESVVASTGDGVESVAVATTQCLDEDIEMFEQA